MNTSLFLTMIQMVKTHVPSRTVSKILWLAVAGFLCTQMAAAQTQGQRDDKNQGAQKKAPAADQSSNGEAKTEWDPSWSPLPEYGQPALPLEQVRETYAFAARNGELLGYVPCYCGCENEGHKSVLDCFVKGRTKTGAPKWDKMGYT